MEATRRVLSAAWAVGTVLAASAASADSPNFAQPQRPAATTAESPAAAPDSAGRVALAGHLEPAGACAPGGACGNGRCGRCGGNGCRGGNGCPPQDEPCRWSDEWYAQQGDGAIGAEQKYRYGKLWPPFARPQKKAECSSIYHAARYWPYPYNCWDRGYVKQVLSIQAANGWLQATTLYGYQFDPETGCLNDSGRLHLRWILESAPPQYRAVYVQASPDPLVSDARLTDVRTQATQMTGGLNSAPIAVRVAMVAGRPATEVDALRRQELETIPKPRIEIDSLGGGVGAGGGGTAQ